MFKFLIATLVALGALALADGPRATRAGENPASLGDLQIAYNLECNAQRQYTVYATTADRAGLHKVATMFRAAARGEEVHASRHAAAIRDFGVRPVASIEPVVMRSTRENLRHALAEETYERDEMYAMFSGQARTDGCTVALASFSGARDAETTHAALFRLAADQLDQMARSETFLVCPGCGSVEAAAHAHACWTCGTPVERLERID